jgi:hypothetical protein
LKLHFIVGLEAWSLERTTGGTEHDLTLIVEITNDLMIKTWAGGVVKTGILGIGLPEDSAAGRVAGPRRFATDINLKTRDVHARGGVDVPLGGETGERR